MRTKSLVAPTGIEKGHYWLSPDGHSPSWNRVWNGTAWANYEEEELEELQLDPDSLEEIEIEIADDDVQPEEDHEDEQGMQTAVPDSNGGEQGASGKPEPEPQQRGKRGKVRKGGKGK